MNIFDKKNAQEKTKQRARTKARAKVKERAREKAKDNPDQHHRTRCSSCARTASTVSNISTVHVHMRQILANANGIHNTASWVHHLAVHLKDYDN